MKNFKDEITDLLQNTDNAVINHFFWSDIEGYLKYKDEDGVAEFSEALETLGITFEHCDDYGGEGQGDEYWSVYKFSNKPTGEFCHIQFDGSYASYCGSEFDSWFFVEPRQVTVTQYVKVKG